MSELWAKPTLNAHTSTVKPNGTLPATGEWSGLIAWLLLSQTRIEVILPQLIVPDRVNKTFTECGLDTRNRCFDTQHFDTYPWSVEYCYNSRGLRDTEWPNNLDDIVWCIGDSFTVGLGCPWNHTWPQVITQKTNRRTINIGMDGASNFWIARQARLILEKIQPRHCVIQWSFLHRTENHHLSPIHHTAQSSDPTHNIPQWRKLCEEFADYTTVIQSVIPGAAPGIGRREAEGWWCNQRQPGWPEILPDSLPKDIAMPAEFNHHWQLQSILKDFNVILVQQKDLARDGFHYDIQTAEWFVEQIAHRLI